MPPLNYLVEDKENGVWRERDTSRGRFSPPSQDLIHKPITAGWASSSRRQAHFADPVDVQVFTISPRDEYSDEEKGACWYTASEYVAFRRDVCTTVYIWKTDAKKLDDLRYTMRGAEASTLDGGKRRNHLRSLGRRVVLDEQAFQRRVGMKDHDRLAKAYSAAVHQAIYDAINLAAVDHNGTERYQTEPFFRDLFDDNWIRSVSMISMGTCCSLQMQKTDAFSVLDEGLGFDDSWLSDMSS